MSRDTSAPHHASLSLESAPQRRWCCALPAMRIPSPKYIFRICFRHLSCSSRASSSCYGHAAAAKRKAGGTCSPAKKAGFLEMEKRWLALARSLEASDRLRDFIGDAKVNKDLPDRLTYQGCGRVRSSVLDESSRKFRAL
jgi:hypothetical protein